jgi:hypothetical protein
MLFQALRATAAISAKRKCGSNGAKINSDGIEPPASKNFRPFKEEKTLALQQPHYA